MAACDGFNVWPPYRIGYMLTAKQGAESMAILKREIDRRATGPVMNDEDWWRLVFDTETKRLYVEHEWAHMDVRQGGPANNGSEEIEITAFLKEDNQRRAHQELSRLISTLFERDA
jgi:hypothetical protein